MNECLAILTVIVCIWIFIGEYAVSQTQKEHQSVDDVDLEYTQNKRRAMLELTTADLSELVKDPERATLVLKLMDSMDKQILGRRRLEVEKDNTVALQQQAFAIGAMLSKNSGGRNPFLLVGESNTTPPVSYLPGFEVSQGELSTTLDTERADEFLARMRAKEEQE